MTRSSLVAALLALAAMLALPAAAPAAKGSQAFMGLNTSGADFSSAATIDASVSAMRKRRAGSLRITLYWRLAQPYALQSDVPESERSRYPVIDGRPTDFSTMDAVVRSAASRGLNVLPTIIGAPGWASTDPSKPFAPPKDVGEFARFAATAARRYGPNGTFWSADPSVPKVPIRDWQIWNEPAGYSGFGSPSTFWDGPLDQALTTYLAMLKASRSDLRQVDGKADIVLAGMFGLSWITMSQLYKAKAGKLFDTAAVHPYTSNAAGDIRILELVRRRMVRNGDALKPLVVTEFSWSSGRGKVPNAPANLGYLTKTEAQQAALLRKTYRVFYESRARLRLRAAYWYTWASPENSTDAPFDYTGLYRIATDGTLVAKPAAVAYSKAAKDLKLAR